MVRTRSGRCGIFGDLAREGFSCTGSDTEVSPAFRTLPTAPHMGKPRPRTDCLCSFYVESEPKGRGWALHRGPVCPSTVTVVR